HGVEAHVVSRMFGVGCKPGFGRGHNPPPLADQHGFGGFVEGLARLDLDERNQPSALDDKIDLARRRFKAPRDRAVALGGGPHRRRLLRRQPQPKGGHALGVLGDLAHRLPSFSASARAYTSRRLRPVSSVTTATASLSEPRASAFFRSVSSSSEET